uniref:THAP-type domain-containing protein n=1 Tax=Knipowitschia caucasica TaxID=637954 RepID=A0AAV2K2G6_KNICA
MRVCSLHFHSGKPSYEMLENHPDWTPSLRCCNTPVSDCVEGVQRLFSNSLMMREKSNKGKMPPRKCDMCRVIQGAVLGPYATRSGLNPHHRRDSPADTAQNVTPFINFHNNVTTHRP